MMNHRPPMTPVNRQRRSGLAPVEMVLLTPLLACLGALMVNFGDAASWKIKSQSNAHYAATQSQAFRASSFDSNRNPRPPSWIPPATRSTGPGEIIQQLESQQWNQERQEYTVALMGNPIQAPYGDIDGWSKDVPPPRASNFTDVSRRMFADRGAHRGNAGIRKRFPIAAILNQSQFDLNNSMEMLSGDWDFGDIGPGRNDARRVEDLYDLNWDELPDVDRLRQGFLDGPVAALRNDYANRQNLMVPDNLAGGTQHAYDALDDDNEFPYYRRGGGSPNFHQHPSGCFLEWFEYGMLPANRGQAPANPFEQYLRRIHRVPRQMGNAWISLYSAEIARQKPRPPDYPGAPPYPRGKHWTELEDEVDKLRKYLENLQGLGY
jgi:hypothetical protein